MHILMNMNHFLTQNISFEEENLPKDDNRKLEIEKFFLTISYLEKPMSLNVIS